MERIITNECIQYKSGFYDGKRDLLEYKHFDNPLLYVVPTMDDTNLYSIGYHDGYCYFLKKLVNKEDFEGDLNREALEKIVFTCFEKAIISYNERTGKDAAIFKFRI